ncbi:MAG: cell division protein FtsH, partial [Solirubrobacterales bacterium]
ESAHQRAKDILLQYREQLTTISEILLRRETIERDEFIKLLDGKTEEEVFGPDEPAAPEALPPAPADRRDPRPLPRPGFAGGATELRGLDLPEKPEPA